MQFVDEQCRKLLLDKTLKMAAKFSYNWSVALVGTFSCCCFCCYCRYCCCCCCCVFDAVCNYHLELYVTTVARAATRTATLCAQNVNVICVPKCTSNMATTTTTTTEGKCCTFKKCAASEVLAAKNQRGTQSSPKEAPREPSGGIRQWQLLQLLDQLMPLCGWINVKTQSRAVNSEQSAGKIGVKKK